MDFYHGISVWGIQWWWEWCCADSEATYPNRRSCIDFVTHEIGCLFRARVLYWDVRDRWTISHTWRCLVQLQNKNVVRWSFLKQKRTLNSFNFSNFSLNFWLSLCFSAIVFRLRIPYLGMYRLNIKYLSYSTPSDSYQNPSLYAHLSSNFSVNPLKVPVTLFLNPSSIKFSYTELIFPEFT